MLERLRAWWRGPRVRVVYVAEPISYDDWLSGVMRELHASEHAAFQQLDHQHQAVDASIAEHRDDLLDFVRHQPPQEKE